ncbi:hypothetical protein BaRGS_00009063 [Batillaria attramentaria]|uniref:5-formyltetrahydrofolate cyclo-ligase n=1 Tax=Batillaria attramentaria TaxID=370345 RepID=A0ABD0LL66_9CAEN
MATLRQAKATLRKEVKKRLAALTTEDKQQQSQIVLNKVLASGWFKDSHRVSLFLSMPDEIDTLPLLRAALNAGKQCFIPYYKGSDMSMVPLASMADYENLPVTKWNIKQPAEDDIRPDAINTGGLDVIFMPGLAFTKQGARLGRGKGYYDGYLTKCHNAGILPRTVALIFREQLVDFVPIGETDVLVQDVLCATEDDLKS